MLEWQTSPRLRAVLSKAASNLRMFFFSSNLRTKPKSTASVIFSSSLHTEPKSTPSNVMTYNHYRGKRM